MEEASSRLTTGELTEINLVIKTDMQGSVDAVRESLNKLTAEDRRVNIIHAGVGTINESDVLLAETIHLHQLQLHQSWQKHIGMNILKIYVKNV